MKLTRFKLIAGGLGGISITCTEYIMSKTGVTFTDEVNRIRKVPFPHKFRQSITKLKYYFLVLTGHWIEPYNKYYDRSIHRIAPLPETGSAPMGQSCLIEIMNKLNITGVVFTGKGFLLTGTIDSYGDKSIGISTRLVTEEDDSGFYHEAVGVINQIFSDVGIFFKENKVIDESPMTYLKEMGYSEKEDLGDLSEEELMNRVLDAFQQRGGIILMPPADITAIGNADDNTTLDTRTGSIDGKHLEEVSAKPEEENNDWKADMDKIDPEKDEALKAAADHIVYEVNKSKAKDKSGSTKNVDNPPKKPETKVPGPENLLDNDREFPQEGISDDDIKSAVGPVTEEIPEVVAPAPKAKRKKEGSTLASEKDFAAVTGETVHEDTSVDLTGAEFSGNGNPEVDDWSQEQVGGEGGLSQEDLDASTQN